MAITSRAIVSVTEGKQNGVEEQLKPDEVNKLWKGQPVFEIILTNDQISRIISETGLVTSRQGVLSLALETISSRKSSPKD